MPARPGAEVIAPGYRPLTLTGPLESVRRVLFGAAPDLGYALYRTAQYLNLLHALETSDWVLALDPRVTYDPNRSGFGLEYAEGVSYRLGENGQTAQLFVVGDPAADDELGRLEFDWAIDLGGGLVTARALFAGPGSDESAGAAAFTSGISPLIPLPRSDGLAVRLQEAAAASWLLTVRCRPAKSLGQVRSELLALDATDRLFSAEEPYATARALWQDSQLLAESLSGLLLAYLYRLEARRLTG